MKLFCLYDKIEVCNNRDILKGTELFKNIDLTMKKRSLKF